MNPDAQRPAPDFALVLRPVRDPLARVNGFDRDPTLRLRYALKTLLRGFGLKCTRVYETVPSDDGNTLARYLDFSELPEKTPESAAVADRV